MHHRRKTPKYQYVSTNPAAWTGAADTTLGAAGQALVLIDGEERRRTELGTYHASCHKLDRETLRLKTFEDRQLPAFLLWADSEFAKELGRLREWHAATQQLQQLVVDVERFASWKRVSKRVALATVEDAHADGTYDDLWVDSAAATQPDDWARTIFDDLRDAAANAEAPGDDWRDDGASPRRDSGRGGAHVRGAATSAEEQPADTYLKTLYRRLVRVLHPDANAAESPAQQRLWHEVQDAYAWGDVQRLERLYKNLVSEGTDVVQLKTASIGDVIALRKAVEARLKKIRSRIRTAQQHPGWGFRGAHLDLKRVRKLKAEIERDIAHDLAMVRMQREELERHVERWRAVPRPRPSKGARRLVTG